jgi:hypothetical protein
MYSIIKQMEILLITEYIKNISSWSHEWKDRFAVYCLTFAATDWSSVCMVLDTPLVEEAPLV